VVDILAACILAAVLARYGAMRWPRAYVAACAVGFFAGSAATSVLHGSWTGAIAMLVVCRLVLIPDFDRERRTHDWPSRPE
jgi:hypothetical protein